MLQEVHCSAKTSKLWSTQWGGRGFFSSGNSSSKGVGILIKPKSKIKVNKVLTDHDGRYVICNIELEEIKYTICCIYAPNCDSPEFFQSVLKTVEKISEPNVIIGGDFNVVLDVDKDRLNSKSNNYRACEYLNMYMNDLNMCDVWRDRFPDTKKIHMV